MKPLLLLFAILATSLAFAEQPAAQPPLITTQGSALVRVVPDLADLCFEVEVRNADLGTARKAQAARAEKVLSALRAAGVAETELQASQVQINADYTEGRQETARVRFFRVSQTFCATLRDVAKVPDVTASVVEAGATGVQNASLRTSELRKYRDEARSKAIRAAKEKAVALAAELGAKVGKPYTITEGVGYSRGNWSNSYSNTSIDPPVIGMGGDQNGDGSTSTFAPGTISITADVTAAFVLE
jgi:hypothetical protein